MNLAFFYIVSVDTALDGYFWKLMSIRVLYPILHGFGSLNAQMITVMIEEKEQEIPTYV